MNDLWGNQLDFGDFSNNHYENYDDYIDPIEPVYGSDTAEDLWKLSDNLLSIIDEVEPTQYPWTSLTNIDLPLLKELDLSGLNNIPFDNFLYPKVYDPISKKGLKSIEKIRLK